MQNVLITGASSALMQELIKKIDRSKFRVFGISRNISKIDGLNIEVLIGDINDQVFIHNIIQDKKIDSIIHAAAITHTRNTADYFKVNLQGTINLVDAAKGNNVHTFIFISSRVAGNKSGDYGLSKLQAEDYLKNNFDHWLIIRPSEIYGSNKNEGIDKLIHDVEQKKIILCPINVKSKLFPIFYIDAAQAIYELIFDHSYEKKVITINGLQGFSNYELIKKISTLLNKYIFIIPIPKFLMFIIKWLLEFSQINAKIVPDQIPRLYSLKETGLSCSGIQIEDYFKKEHKNKRFT
ncbi:MAG: NAD(P)-dependent oxidoreductase [Bacteroidia bacterium]|nr:NAD(P)-dependent oxidoreductase [Bacteroidia bacterium]